MPCSPDRLQSNRRNALRSTGPRTPGGKARSRANAVAHGLTGAGVALPIEDAAEVDRRFRALGDDLRPVGERERILAERAAFLSVRLDRCRRYETAALAEAIRTAGADHDDDRRRDVEAAVDRLADEPAASTRRLSRTPEGVDWMLTAWSELEGELTQAGFWTFPLVLRAENLMGRKADDPCTSRVHALHSATHGDFRLLDPPGTPINPDPAVDRARRADAMAALIALIHAEVDRLRALRAALPLDEIARGRAEAPLRRLFDPSGAAVLFRRYETAAARELHRTFAHFDADRPAADPDDPPSTDPDEESRRAGLALPGSSDRQGEPCPTGQNDPVPPEDSSSSADCGETCGELASFRCARPSLVDLVS